MAEHQTMKCWDCWQGIREVPGCMGSSSEKCDTCDGKGNYWIPTGWSETDRICPKCRKRSIMTTRMNEHSVLLFSCFNFLRGLRERCDWKATSADKE